ncbi:MAG: PAS domain-containing protein [Gammaproteobacteria bacterium]|nr:PAS domain-containing protein [Gammaproteobacteria bacterium]
MEPIAQPGTAATPAALAEAFGVFVAASHTLNASYQALAEEVARLRQGLQQAEAGRDAESHRRGELAARLTALLDALPGGVLLLDASGTVLQANASALDMLGVALVDQRWDEIRERACETGAREHGDLALRDGRRVALAQQTLQPGPGRVLLLTDVTAKRKLEELLARHQRLAAMGEMAAALAHQLRTPLAAGLLYVGNARRPGLGEAQRDGLLARAAGCLQDLETLIADMLQFARGARLAGDRCDIGDLLDGVGTALGAILLPTQTLHIERPAGPVTLTGNREALTGALLNVVTNALEAAGDHATVHLVARATPFGADILVRDDGPGIAPELRERIFEPFFTSRATGTGLGLAVARSVARAHHGDITLLDATPGRTTFTLRLPVSAGALPAARTVAA